MAAFLFFLGIIILIVFLFIRYFYNTDNHVGSNNNYPTLNYRYISSKWLYLDTQTNENVSAYITNKSPEEVKKLFDHLKFHNVWIDEKIFRLFIEKIAQIYKEERLQKIAGMTPSECYQWYLEVKAEHIHLGSEVYNALALKLAEYQEQEILNILDSTAPSAIDSKMSALKNKEYFFTEKVIKHAEYRKSLKKVRQIKPLVEISDYQFDNVPILTLVDRKKYLSERISKLKRKVNLDPGTFKAEEYSIEINNANEELSAIIIYLDKKKNIT